MQLLHHIAGQPTPSPQRHPVPRYPAQPRFRAARRVLGLPLFGRLRPAV